MEPELELGLKEKPTNAYIAYLKRSPNSFNAKEYGGIQSVFPKRKLQELRLLTRYRVIMTMRGSH